MKGKKQNSSEGKAALTTARIKGSPVFFIIRLLGCLICFSSLFLAGCATTQELPPRPPKYVYNTEKAPQSSVNSLWHDTASLYEDRKARRLNDLVTIRVVENTTASGTTSTKASRDSSGDYALTQLFGMNKDLNIQNIPLVKEFYKGGAAFNPAIKGSGVSEFDGKGDTARAGSLIGTITAKVVEVMPNGNLVLESRKDLTINDEKQTLVLRGLIRPDDILPDNTVLSSSVADADIFFVGDGVLQEKQRPGWLVRFLDKITPF